MISKFIRVNINKNPVEFSCPLCGTIMYTYKEGDTPQKLQAYCPYCLGAIDPTGVQPYTGEAKQPDTLGNNIGDFYILMGDEYGSYNHHIVVFNSASIRLAAAMDGLTLSQDGDGNDGYEILSIVDSNNYLKSSNTTLNQHLLGNYLEVKTHSLYNFTSTTINGVTVQKGDKLAFDSKGKMTVVRETSGGGSNTNPSDPQKPGGDMNFDQIT